MSDPNTTELDRIRIQLFEAQLRLGCVEQDHPGLADAAYKRFCERIMAQIAAANKPAPAIDGPAGETL